jgi:hypothetical protein
LKWLLGNDCHCNLLSSPSAFDWLTGLRENCNNHPFLVSTGPGHRGLADAAAKLLDEGRLEPWAAGVVEKHRPEMYVLRHAVILGCSPEERKLCQELLEES